MDLLRKKKLGIIEAYAAVVESSGIFTSINFRRKLIGTDGQAHQVKTRRVHQKRAIIGHDGAMHLALNPIAALLERHTKTEFGECVVIGVNIPVVSKIGCVRSEDGTKEIGKGASRRSSGLNQIGQASILEAIFASPRIHLAATPDSHIEAKPVGLVLADPPACFLSEACKIVAGTSERLRFRPGH